MEHNECLKTWRQLIEKNNSTSKEVAVRNLSLEVFDKLWGYGWKKKLISQKTNWQ